MDMDFKVAEITLQYKPTCKKQSKVFGSEEAYNILLPTFKEGTIEYREYAKVLYLNQANEVIAYNTISEGGLTETAVDLRIILQGALLTMPRRSYLLKAQPTGWYAYKRTTESLSDYEDTVYWPYNHVSR